MLSTLGGRGAIRLVAHRGFATIRKTRTKPLAQSILDNLPATEDDNVVARELPALKYSRNPVNSAHCIDTAKGEISSLDSVALSPSGSVVHGRYGDLGSAADGIPLEYLALLRPAAEGAAAVRALSSSGKKGTMLVYGASSANGLAATQLASAAGNAVVAVVGNEHASNEIMMDCIKGLVNEPGTVVPEVYALSKKNFSDLVDGVSTGEDGSDGAGAGANDYVSDFKDNLLAYIAAYPEDFPAAVDAERFKFLGMEKDRENFRTNMEQYLSQYNPGSPPIDKIQLDANFTKDQYQIFRNKFWTQTTNVVSGDRIHFFSPPHLVKELVDEPEVAESTDSREFPYSFSILDDANAAESEVGGPVLGAVISVTPDLEIAASAIAAAEGLRAKGEALHFLTSHQRTVFGAACSVAAVAKKHGAPVYVMGGSLPGLESVAEPTDDDVKSALTAMDIDDDGNSKLNYFVQVYRACDFPFYGDYAIHKATEEMAGPRQVIVAK